MAKHVELPDTNQSVWQLSAIQLSGWTSLPILATSILVLEQNSFYGAILTIIVGNAIAWFIRLAIIMMSYEKRQSTLDIAKVYLGNMGGYFIGAFLLISTLAWFIAQTTAASKTLTHLLLIEENPSIDKFTQISVFVGIVSTFLCMEGVTLLKKLASFVFPFLIAAFIAVIFIIPFKLPEITTAGLSLAGLTLVLITNLGITSDLPTFFRHSKSLHTSIKALTVIQLVSLAIALLGLYLGSIITGAFEINEALVLGTSSEVLRLSLIIFIFLSVICANVANVYSASVGWEVIAPKALLGRKEYLILGLGLTTIFILVSNLFSIEFLLNSSDSSLVNLCIILIIGYMLSKARKSEPSRFEQVGYFTAWFVSTTLNILQFSEILPIHISPIATSLASILIILSLFFLTKRCITKRV